MGPGRKNRPRWLHFRLGLLAGSPSRKPNKTARRSIKDKHKRSSPYVLFRVSDGPRRLFYLYKRQINLCARMARSPHPPTALLHSGNNFTNEPFSRHLGTGAALDGGLTTAGWWLRRKHRRKHRCAPHRSPVPPKCILPLCEKHPEVAEKNGRVRLPRTKTCCAWQMTEPGEAGRSLLTAEPGGAGRSSLNK